MKIQFSIRGLLMIVAIVALATGWWIDHKRIVGQMNRQWEYRLDRTLTNSYSFNLNGGEQSGWEDCGIAPIPKDLQSGEEVLIMRRPKQ